MHVSLLVAGAVRRKAPDRDDAYLTGEADLIFVRDLKTWLAQSVERVALDLWVTSSGPTLGVEPT